ncbi:MAG: thymidylate synthase [Candidatus Sumerlaeota bacterium]|nr:thymidylate synthase [Candidatus Sumerlaeota bacterium]
MKGNIPVLSVSGRSLAAAWENSLLELYSKGIRIQTEYDKPGDPLSLDSTMLITIEEPKSEPRIHRAFPGGLEFLEEYRQEVVEGIKDHWIRDPNNPEDQRWEYTYHERLFSYRIPGLQTSFDQIDAVAGKLSRKPFSRRAQAITWKVWEDLNIHDPACLQSIWCRILPGEDDIWTLNMNVRFRSNDAYEAAFMNMFAILSLQEKIAEKISEKAGRPVTIGRYLHLADSYHIYGSRIEDFKSRFLSQIEKRTFEERTWTMEFAQPLFDEAKVKIAEKVKRQTEKYL